MSNGSTLSLPEIEDRIAIVRDNIRQLIEQAAAFSGAEDEERNADRIAQQNEELEALVKQRDALLKKNNNIFEFRCAQFLPRLRGRVGRGPAASRLAQARTLAPSAIASLGVLPRKRGRKLFTPPSVPRP